MTTTNIAEAEKKCKTQEEKEMGKRSRNQHLKLKIVSFLESLFHTYTSFSCAFIRSHVFCEFSCFRNFIDFFSLLWFVRSFSSFSVRFYSLLFSVMQPFHPFHFDDRGAKKCRINSFFLRHTIRFCFQFRISRMHSFSIDFVFDFALNMYVNVCAE